MIKSLIMISLLQLLAAGCSGDIKLTVFNGPPLSEEVCISRPEKVGCSDLMKERALKLEQAWPLNSFQGQVVNLKGRSFDKHLQLTIDGQEVALVKTNASEAYFLTPAFASPGLKTALLKRRDQNHEFKIYILADTSINPSWLTEPSQLCEGTEFMLSDGSLALGSKYCSTAPSSFPNCSEDGEVGCITSNSFTAGDIRSAANKILAGEIVSGVEGKLALPAASKVLSGEVFGAPDQALTGTLILPSPASVRSAFGPYGVGGNGSSPALADCSAANQSTCVATTLFKTMNLTAAGSDAALTSANFDSTIRAPGNFEFWDAAGQRHSLAGDTDLIVANVKTGVTIFGVAGGLTTTPVNCSSDGEANCLVDGGSFAAGAIAGAASKILSGQTLAGVNGNVTLPLAGKVLSATAYGVAGTGSTGTLTLPAAAHVLSSNGNFGDASALTTPTLILPDAGKVLSGTSYGVAGTGSTGALTLPSAGNVLTGTGTYGDTTALITPTLTLPLVGKVLSTTAYGVAGTGSTGTLTLPAAGAVRSSAGAYGDSGSAVTGTISDCAANDSACYVPSYTLTTQPLRAISYDAIDAGKASIRSSLTVGGVTGTMADCADGDIGCYILGPNFKAAAVNAGTSDKILSGQSVAGVNGNVTLPAANRVLTGNSFGVAGTDFLGSLTLPAAQNVLSGSAAYGDSLASLTPTLTLPAVGRVLTATVYGVSGTDSTGTLTLPAADHVLSSNGNFGDASALTTPTLTLPAVGKVLSATAYGVAGTGSTGTLTLPAADHVLSSNGNFGDASALTTPTLSLPAAGKVLSGTSYGAAGTGSTGALTLPSAGNVLTGTGIYGDTAALMTPTLTLPLVGKVLNATAYGVAGTGSTGTLILPAAGAVRSSAGAYGDSGSAVTGTISDCMAHDSACYLPSYVATTQPLRAISYDAIDAGKASIRSTLTVGGVTGTLTDCADGDIGCYILGPNFKAVAVSGSTGDKILFGQVLAGYSGTVTLPLANKVLSGQSYGVGGNGLAGSLTVPAAGNVLSGSGTYGDALALITPTLTLPDSSKVLTGTSFGVSGSTSSGALTLPSAANVLAGSGSYGDSLSQTSPTYVCPSYVRPASPTITSINFNLTPDRVIVNWGAVSGAAGYIVIMKSNAAVTWTPTDGQSYGTGVQGSDTIIYSGSGTSVTYNTNVTAGVTYHFAIYSYIANIIYSYLPSTSSLTSCAGLSGSWVAVPGDSTYGTSGFCVMKYEAKNPGNLGVATSAAAGTPWVNISRTAASVACSSLGANFHLITNDEWMSLASNIASTASNWSGGSVNSGAINQGHTDDNPSAACRAHTNDTYGYLETNCTPKNSGTWSQKRTHTLSTGAVIWDVAGNVHDWTSYGARGGNWYEGPTASIFSDWPVGPTFYDTDIGFRCARMASP